jgi:alkylation response protein AidB-like acyl-CoA dehydrogenase
MPAPHRLMGIGYPEALGGTPADLFFTIAAAEEIARAGSGGVQASLGSHHIALPPIVAHGSPALQQRVLPPVLAGEKIAALAITEPGGGSDVAALKTTALRDGDHYVVNGEKTFITSGMRADFLTDPPTRGRAACRCCSSTVPAPACSARCWPRPAGGRRTPRTCVSTSAACRPAT